MNMIKGKNYSRGKLIRCPIPSNGDIFEQCNFSQEKPYTILFAGINNLTFIKCNLFNCSPPENAQLDMCTNIQKSTCSHLHPKWTTLDECPENCSHVVDIDEITIDGVLVDTIYHYEDTLL